MATFADSSAVVTVTSSATADTDGAWVQLFNPTSKNYKWMCVSLFSILGPIAKFDIGTGEPGSQVDDIIQDQFAMWTVTAGTGLVNTVFSLPMPIDSGTKLWIRIKDATASALDYEACVTLSTIPLSATIPTSSESFSNQGGISSPASAGDFGTWITMFNSLAVDRKWLSLVLFSVEGVSLEARFDIGSGDSPIVVDWGELHFQMRHEGSSQRRGAVYNIPVSWAEGTKLSLRVKDNLGTQRFYWVGATIF